jgi:acyl CoA:acetate/3-ketoacid CoA transferase alpha subunit
VPATDHGPPEGSDGKLVPLERAAELVPNGCTLAVGGLSLNTAPMAFCRELVRAGVSDLELVSAISGMSTDWLIGGACISRIVMALVSFEGFGLAPLFRRAAEQRAIEVHEYSEHTLISMLAAATAGVPFMPTRAGLGTDMIRLHPERTREVVDERTGQRYVACAALRPDVAVIHAHEADVSGNVRMLPKMVWFDTEIVKASSRVIVTVERIVDTESFRAHPEQTAFPRFAIDHIVHAPRGAWPTACWPEYAHDAAFYAAYQRAAKDPGAFSELFAEHVGPLRWSGG